MSVNPRLAVLHVYRNLLRVVSHIPDTDVNQARKQIQEAFRENAQVEDSDQIAELINKAEGRYGFLQMKANISPYKRLHRRDIYVAIVNDDEKNTPVERDRAFFRNDHYLDPTYLKKHKQLTQRMHDMKF